MKVIGLASDWMNRSERMTDRELIAALVAFHLTQPYRSVEGERYFTCKPNHGVFVRPERVITGDWPEVDEFADMDDEDEI